MTKKVAKICGGILAVLLILILLIWLLLKIPSVQNFVGGVLADQMTKSLGVKVDVGHVRFKLFRDLLLEDLYLEDQAGDTLLHIKSSTLAIGHFDFWRKELHGRDLSLDGISFISSKSLEAGQSNSQFLLDYFSNGSGDTSSTSWQIDLEKVRITNGHITHKDMVDGSETTVDIGRLFLYPEHLDFKKKRISIRQFALSESDFRYKKTLKEGNAPMPDQTPSNRQVSLQFPDVGWEIDIRQIIFENNLLAYDDHNFTGKVGELDLNHLQLDDVDVIIKDFQMNGVKIGAKIEKAHLEDSQGFKIDQIEGILSMSQKQMMLRDLYIETPLSRLKNNTTIAYTTFEQLRFIDSLNLFADFAQGRIHLSDLKYIWPGFNDLSFINQDLEYPVQVSGEIKGQVNELDFHNFSFVAKDLLELELEGRISDILDPNKVSFNAEIRNLSTSYDALHVLTKDLALPLGIKPWGDFNFKGGLSGRLSDLTIRNMSLQTGSVTGFEGDVNIKGLPNIEDTYFNLDVRAMRSQSQDLAGFIEGKFPSAFDSLGVFYYQGDFRGTIYNFEADGNLISEAGRVRTDIKFDFSDDFSDAEFSGDIRMDSFNLGQLVGDTSVGSLSLEVNIFGHGLNFDELRATVLGEVKELDYRGYTYRDLSVDGRFIQRKFVGHASIDDPNLKVDYEGVVNFADSNARFKFDASIDTINFIALNLSGQPFGLNATVASDFEGNDFNTMKGEVFIEDLVVNNAHQFHRTDSIYIYSDNVSAGNRLLKIESPHLNGEVSGDFVPSALPGLIVQFFDQFFPIYENIATQSDTTIFSPSGDLVVDQSIEYNITLQQAGPFLSIFSPSPVKLDSLNVTGHLNTTDNTSSLFGYIGSLSYGAQSFGPIRLTSLGEEGVLDNVVTIRDAVVSDDLSFPFLYMDATVLDDTAYVSAVFQDKSVGGEKLSFAGMASRQAGQYKLELNRSMTINDEDWAVNRDNVITFANGLIDVQDLDISKGDQKLSIQSRSNSNQMSDVPLDISFNRFELDEIGTFLSIEDLFYQGQIDGDITLENLTGDIKYLADLKLNELTLRDEKVGNLIIKSQQRTRELIDVLVTLEGGKSGFDLRGDYNIETAQMSLQGELDRLSLSALDPFLEGKIHESSGEISGLVSIGGTLQSPNVNGAVELDQVSTIIDYLQGRYTIENEDIRIENNKVILDDITLIDPLANEAKLNGTFIYRNSDDTDLDIVLKADRFQILNTTYKDNDLYYGSIFVNAEVQISGDTDHPKYLVNARTLEGTKFYMQPLGNNYAYAQEDFIIYDNPTNFALDTIRTVQDLIAKNKFGIDLTANIILTPEAELEIIVDPVTGDKLVCHGNSDLSIEMTPQGAVKVLGNYIITEGQYAFTFQKVLRRNFDIEEGSRVNFIGEPMRSRFDIRAIYSVKTSTYELIRNQSTLSESEEVNSRKRTDVEVNLNLKGDLEKPIAKFDIRIPDTRSDAVAGSVTSKIAQLRESESDMNKQVFGLLILNSFIAEQQATGADIIADASQTAILGSVSSLISNELNKLAKRYIKGVDLDFGFDSYNNTSDKLVTELEVGLSKRLLDDRLTVRLGGNFQFDNGTDYDVLGQQNSTFSGDFILEYKLSPSGNYNLKFFQALSNEENVLSPGANYSETGVSLLFSKTFNSERYLLQLKEGEGDSEDIEKQVSNE